jgi:adenosylcobinamide-phosphate synthase
MITMTAFVPALAVLADSLIGDPRVKWHPVVLIGNLIASLEQCLLRSDRSPLRKVFAGGLLVSVVLVVSYLAVWLILKGLYYLHPFAAYAGSVVIMAFTISPRSLAEAGIEIRNYLRKDDLEQARYKVSWIVGRDTAELDIPEVTRATVETVAENIVDGVISPLFYAFLGGAPLAFLYRAANTMDSMIGYKNEKYRDFGMLAARLDDILNYIPARITGILIIIAAAILRLDAGGAVMAIRQDAAKHPSPNSGFAEAGVAGALGICLGGLNYYGGVPSHRAYMGQGRVSLEPGHITDAIKILYSVTWLFTLLATSIILVITTV